MKKYHGYKSQFRCPCCQNILFIIMDDESKICPICGWQYEKQQLEDPDYKGGANALSLNEARKKYQKSKKFGVVDLFGWFTEVFLKLLP